MGENVGGIPLDEMDLKTFISYVNTLNLLSHAYNDLKEDVEDKKRLEMVTNLMVSEIFPDAVTYEIHAPIKCSFAVDAGILNLLTYGQYNKYLQTGDESYTEVFKGLKLHTLKNILEYPLEFNAKKPFSMVITTDKESRVKAESLIQYIMFSLLSSSPKGYVRCRCADKEKGGQSFGKFINLIGKNNLFGKGICSNDAAIVQMVKELNDITESNFAKLEGKYQSVYDFNASATKPLPVTLVVFCDTAGFDYSDSNGDLQKVLNNAENSAINTIFLLNEGAPIGFTPTENQFHISFKKGEAHISLCGMNVRLKTDKAEFTNEEFQVLEAKLNAIEKVDTNFKSHYDIENLQLFTRDATKGLKIPFAFDANKNFVDLEIGDVTPHALLSGSTGSGKSVTLHSIINQIMINYHPDDVEIWAIDYKAVEFGYYVNKRTPHITVIGQDNSVDFTLGLLDLIKGEYDRRKKLFVNAKVKDFKAYRAKFGNRSITRMLIVIDEFHNMTQAIAGYMGEKNYKQILENLLSEMRAMGMSFLFCSQTISAGLNGLTEKARTQIGCRLSMKHQDILEIKETLSLSATEEVDFNKIKYLRQGELIYKKISNSQSGPPYTLEQVNVLFTEPYRDEIIDIINNNIEKGYVKRDEIICKNSERYSVLEKQKHPLSKFIDKGEPFESEMLTIFPGAPTSLDDSFLFTLDCEAGNNVMIIGEDDDLRESLIITSIMGMLLDSQNKVFVSIVDINSADSQRLYKLLKKIKSDNLILNYGFDDVMACISSLKKIRPLYNAREIYFWYGLNKLNNLIFLNSQENEDADDYEMPDKYSPFSAPQEIKEGENPVDFLSNILKGLESSGNKTDIPVSKDKNANQLTYDDCKSIIKKLEEYGPENNRYCFMVSNTVKSLFKSKISNVDNYEYRIGLKMSTDDSYDLFGVSSFVNSADEKTAVFYSGGKIPKTIRPYVLPSDEIVNKYNSRLEK